MACRSLEGEYMRCYFKTYGCQMNERDSEAVAALLRRSGHVLTETEAEADVVIVNTCSVRGKAEDKALGKLGLLSARRENGLRVVGAMGCMVQRMGARIFEKVPGLDFAVGPRRSAGIPELLDRILAGERHLLDCAEDDKAVHELGWHLDGPVSGFVNILLGCDRRCAYCIVPDVRGREWSRPAVDIVDEVGRLVKGGCREVTLLGQSVMSYGRKQDAFAADESSPGGYHEPLPRLLEAVSQVDGLARIRFTSGHPSGCTPELVRAMFELGPVCEHLHLPVQSGSDRILARMRRGYTVADYRLAVERLRKAMPAMALTTDVIVGFPSETDAEFEQTRRFMDEIGFDNAFIFKYSPRPGTPAAAWPDDVPDAEKMRRNQVLLEDQERRGLALNRRLIGTVQEVLVEGPSRRNPHRWSGRTRGNKIVIFPKPQPVVPGAVVSVHIDKVRAQTLYGELVVSQQGV